MWLNITLSQDNLVQMSRENMIYIYIERERERSCCADGFTPRNQDMFSWVILYFVRDALWKCASKAPFNPVFLPCFWKATSADASNGCISTVSICFGLVPSTKVSPKMGCVIDKILDAAFEIHMLRHWNRSFHDMYHGLILFIVP